jgi:hypothetical protein
VENAPENDEESISKTNTNATVITRLLANFLFINQPQSAGEYKNVYKG